MSAPTLRSDERHEPARDGDREQRQEREHREEVALVDARRQHEEADGEEGRGHDDGPAVVAHGGAGERPEEAADEQRRPDGDGRDGPERAAPCRSPTSCAVRRATGRRPSPTSAQGLKALTVRYS